MINFEEHLAAIIGRPSTQRPFVCDGHPSKRLRAAGKPAKVAIVAVMRNLIEIANALIKENRKWTPKAA